MVFLKHFEVQHDPDHGWARSRSCRAECFVCFCVVFSVVSPCVRPGLREASEMVKYRPKREPVVEIRACFEGASYTMCSWILGRLLPGWSR